MKQQSVSGVILAGGKSSRMGQDKALINWKGKRLVDHLIAAMEPICQELLISTHLDTKYFPNYPVIRDQYTDIGPLAGIESGLRHASNQTVLFASVDTPLLSSDLFVFLLSHHKQFDISLAAHNGINEPMIGVYQKRIHPVVIAYIEKGKNKPPELIRLTRWQEIEINSNHNFYHSHLFKNLNRPQDLE